MKHYIQAQFLAETPVKGYQAPGAEPSPDKLMLSFNGTDSRGLPKIENITRGTEDKFKYEPGQVYDVPVATSVFKDRIYYRTVGGTEKSGKKA